MTNLETYGDLKKLINNIKLKQKGEKILSKGKEFALDQVLGLIPGASNARSAFDFIKTAISKPDNKKTGTWLDKLDIDDDMSKIVDDTVENGFMQTMSKSIEREDDNKKLEDDFNMNLKMVIYLKDTYGGRTVTGIKENKMNLKEQIREQIKNLLIESEPEIKGSINFPLYKKLGVEKFNPSNFQTTINLVKQGKVLNNAANKILADVFIAMIKTSDDTLLNTIFQNLKNIDSGTK